MCVSLCLGVGLCPTILKTLILTQLPTLISIFTNWLQGQTC
uniref:Uncharacterized protein n=1 Tax=Rhizophora mucronata TaxID=61149 RepID=A0A2P2NC10_RHIMU